MALISPGLEKLIKISLQHVFMQHHLVSLGTLLQPWCFVYYSRYQRGLFCLVFAASPFRTAGSLGRSHFLRFQWLQGLS